MVKRKPFPERCRQIQASFRRKHDKEVDRRGTKAYLDISNATEVANVCDDGVKPSPGNSLGAAILLGEKT